MHKNYIFRASFTKNGITYYAKDYGKKAFRIYIDPRTGVGIAKL